MASTVAVGKTPLHTGVTSLESLSLRDRTGPSRTLGTRAVCSRKPAVLAAGHCLPLEVEFPATVVRRPRARPSLVRHQPPGSGFAAGASFCPRKQTMQGFNGVAGDGALHVTRSSLPGLDFVTGAFSQQPPTWESSITVTTTVFALGYLGLASGLSPQGIAAAYVLGLLVWRAFGFPGFLTVCLYFIIGTAVTKVRMKQKEAEGIAEKKKGRRGPASVVGSGFAGALCALAAIALGVSMASAGDAEWQYKLLQLGFVASFCTKLSDTTSSEIGKAYGKSTYLVTTLEPVPRGTEGAISLEGTLAGLAAAVFLAFLAILSGEISPVGALLCIVASQIANYGESYVGATLQDKPGYEWLNNDVVNVINISIGATLAMLAGCLLPAV